MTLNERLTALLGRAGTSLCEAQESVDARRDPDTACAIVDAWEQVKQALELLGEAEAEIERDLQHQASLEVRREQDALNILRALGGGRKA